MKTMASFPFAPMLEEIFFKPTDQNSNNLELIAGRENNLVGLFVGSPFTKIAKINLILQKKTTKNMAARWSWIIEAIKGEIRIQNDLAEMATR